MWFLLREKPMKNILVLLAHPSIKTSNINSALFKEVNPQEQVTTVNLYEEYPDFNIDIAIEQERLLKHNVIIFLFPTYWYSTPSLLKEWQDKVLEYGFAYGTTGNKLHGKTLMCVTSTGSPKSVYENKGTNELMIRSILLPLELMAKDTGMKFIDPLVLYGARTAVIENRLQSHVESFVETIEALKTRFQDNK